MIFDDERQLWLPRKVLRTLERERIKREVIEELGPCYIRADLIPMPKPAEESLREIKEIIAIHTPNPKAN